MWDMIKYNKGNSLYIYIYTHFEMRNVKDIKFFIKKIGAKMMWSLFIGDY